jgi:23S rRNA pseudouridine955/2504/2580 synthase
MAEIFKVTPDEVNIRLDRWFKRHYPDVAHGMVEKWLRTGQVRVDGKRVEANLRLEAGQEIRVPPVAGPTDASSPNGRPKPQPKPVDERSLNLLRQCILHIDDHLIVLNKPAGLAVQGGTGMESNHLDAMLGGLQFDAPERPRLVHRLDKDTSGILVLGRTLNATAKLTASFKSREARKCYWSVVVGVPKLQQGRIEAALAKTTGTHKDKMAVDEDDGRAALTWYRIIDTIGRKAAWLEMEPRTGRTHQLRVHSTLLDTPIQGDGKYGGVGAYLDGVEISRKLHLHARAIRMPHPAGGELFTVAPMPAHMSETFRLLGFSEADARTPFTAFDDQ